MVWEEIGPISAHVTSIHLKSPHFTSRLSRPLASPCVTSRHLVSPNVTLCYLTSPQITSRHLMSPRVTLRHVTSPHINLCHLTSPHAISRHLTSPHVAPGHQRQRRSRAKSWRVYLNIQRFSSENYLKNLFSPSTSLGSWGDEKMKG